MVCSCTRFHMVSILKHWELVFTLPYNRAQIGTRILCRDAASISSEQCYRIGGWTSRKGALAPPTSFPAPPRNAASHLGSASCDQRAKEAKRTLCRQRKGMNLPASERRKVCRNIRPLMHTDPEVSNPYLCQTVDSQDPLSLHLPQQPTSSPQRPILNFVVCADQGATASRRRWREACMQRRAPGSRLLVVHRSLTTHHSLDPSRISPSPSICCSAPL